MQNKLDELKGDLKQTIQQYKLLVETYDEFIQSIGAEESYKNFLEKRGVKDDQKRNNDLFYGWNFITGENGKVLVSQQMFDDVSRRIASPDFSNCVFRGIRVWVNTLSNANFSRSKFDDCLFSGEYMQASFIKSTFSDCTHTYCHYDKCNFDGSIFQTTHIDYTTIEHTSFEQVTYEGGRITHDITLESNSFAGTTFTDVDFDDGEERFMKQIGREPEKKIDQKKKSYGESR